ncbi:hypothetical protein DFP72DRAFT_865583 [Ephemerocybe angulata]|uniref:Uncharacterized protein n=1 Tax=Ephemerocybe angulata TaxID=980116 RepID=A0A8H6IKE6_9AGAR|nr:hypothetical protein DFP72DRAFT_865583 [Tulosesus angulatus]
MPAKEKQGGSPKAPSKPTTRSSLRQSLNLASVGKAIIAGVRSNHSSTDEQRIAKKSRESSKRLSVTPQQASAPRASIGGESRPLAKPSKRENTPEAKPITRKRVSGQHTATRGSSSRPKSANPPAASALPKLRSRAIAAETTKPPSPAPAKAGARRRLSTSSSEEGGKEQRKPQASPSVERNTRPISPLPHRAALKSSSAVNATPPATPSTPSKLKPPSSPTIPKNGSPTRPTKLMKTTNTSTTKNLPRPHQHLALLRPTHPNRSPMTPSRDSPSPLARRQRQQMSKSTASSSFASTSAGNMSNISEGNTEDSDEEDDQLLRCQESSARTRRRIVNAPETPSREKPSLKNSLLFPPANRNSSLRPPKPSANNERAQAARASILSWEHASLSASQYLGPGEADKMLYDVQAPFSGPTSPTTSHMEIPPSPCLSAIDSPGLGFGSISQVLLPDVTPSPAVHLNGSRFSISPEAAGESSTTYLRLQLAAAEDLSIERMHRIMGLEEELHNVKQSHMRDLEEYAMQLDHAEKNDDRARHIAALEEQLRALRARAEKERALRVQRRKLDAVYATVLAGTAWGNVKEACQVELEVMQEEKQVLSCLLAQLEAMTLSL